VSWKGVWDDVCEVAWSFIEQSEDGREIEGSSAGSSKGEEEKRRVALWSNFTVCPRTGWEALQRIQVERDEIRRGSAQELSEG
jgi:hypothetical protein